MPSRWESLAGRFDDTPTRNRWVARGLGLSQLSAKVGPMLVRGAWHRLWLSGGGGLVLVGKHVTIRNPQWIRAGRNLVVEDFSEIQGLSSEGIVFGDDVVIGRFAMVRPSSYYSRDLGRGLRVGNGSNIGPECMIGCYGGVDIGANVMMSPGVRIFAENHRFDDNSQPMKTQGVTRARVVIEDDCWLASGSTILAGVRIGRGSVVAAGAVVTRSVPPYSVVAGVPAHVIRSRERGPAAT